MKENRMERQKGLFSDTAQRKRYLCALGMIWLMVGVSEFFPMLLPAETLIWLPLQPAVGTTLFIAIGMIFFHQCYKWSRTQLGLLPHSPLSA